MARNRCLSKMMFVVGACSLAGCITMVDASKLYNLDKVLKHNNNLCINLEIKRYSNSFWSNKITQDRPQEIDKNLRTYLNEAANINSECSTGKKYQILITTDTDMQIYNKGLAYIGTGLTFGLLPSGNRVKYSFILNKINGNAIKEIDHSEIVVDYYFGLYFEMARDPFKKRADVVIEGLPLLTSEQAMELSILSHMLNKK